MQSMYDELFCSENCDVLSPFGSFVANERRREGNKNKIVN